MFNLGFDSQQLFKAKQKSQLSVWRSRNKSRVILAHVRINHHILEYLSGLMESWRNSLKPQEVSPGGMLMTSELGKNHSTMPDPKI